MEEEKNETDAFDIIIKLISSVIGKEFYEIEEDAPMVQYKLLKAKEPIKKVGFWSRLFRR